VCPNQGPVWVHKEEADTKVREWPDQDRRGLCEGQFLVKNQKGKKRSEILFLSLLELLGWAWPESPHWSSSSTYTWFCEVP
jgi:hypothetical protein